MSEPLVPTATIMLDRERTLRMDLNALSDFEQMTGKSIMHGGLDMETLGIADVRALLWACLVQEDESLTIHDVGALIHARNLKEVSAAISSLMDEAMPELKEAGEPLPLPEASASASTG